ncbi:MAG TPA: hypothetical protein VNF47_07990 [Streptosporangiaceae bacterium]|nr:hypothetical protein [Streptosporangiaceae bacterium]
MLDGGDAALGDAHPGGDVGLGDAQAAAHVGDAVGALLGSDLFHADGDGGLVLASGKNSSRNSSRV